MSKLDICVSTPEQTMPKLSLDLHIEISVSNLILTCDPIHSPLLSLEVSEFQKSKIKVFKRHVPNDPGDPSKQSLESLEYGINIFQLTYC